MVLDYFRVTISTVDHCSGRVDGICYLGNFFRRESAEKYAKEWEANHQSWTKWGMGFDCKWDREKDYIHYNFIIEEVILKIEED